MTIYVLHGYTDGLIDPIPSTDYEEVYAAMKAAYEEIMANVEPDDPDREYCFLEGWSATAVVHGDWMEWQIADSSKIQGAISYEKRRTDPAVPD